MHAGPFGAWLEAARAALRGERRGLDVPCGECVACCTSSLFVHIAPSEAATVAVIPARLLVRAPGHPGGHKLLGFAEDGSCPMLKERICSIYEQRPRTCRDYDCRMLAAAGLDAGDGKDDITWRVGAWAFSYENDAARQAQPPVRRYRTMKACMPNAPTLHAAYDDGPSSARNPIEEVRARAQ